jgi:hypothetical protein
LVNKMHKRQLHLSQMIFAISPPSLVHSCFSTISHRMARTRVAASEENKI